MTKKKPYSVIKYHVPSYQSACDAFPLSVSTGQLELITRARSRTHTPVGQRSNHETNTNQRSVGTPSVSVGWNGSNTLTHAHIHTAKPLGGRNVFSGATIESHHNRYRCHHSSLARSVARFFGYGAAENCGGILRVCMCVCGTGTKGKRQRGAERS